MVNLQLVHYIEKELDKGFTNKQITQILIKNNYNQTEIKECLNYLKAKKTDNHIVTTEIEVNNTEKNIKNITNVKSVDENNELIQPTNEIIDNKKHFKMPIHYTPRNMWKIIGAIIFIIFGTFIIITAANYKQQPNEENNATNINNITTEPITNYTNQIQTNHQKSGRIGKNFNEEEKQQLYNNLYDGCISHKLTFADKTCLALGSTDITKCNSDKECIDDYNFYNALKSNDLTTCNKISDNEFKSICIMVINNNIENCNEINDETEKILCETVILNQENKCNLFSNEDGKNLCIDYLNFINGLKGNIKNCKMIKNDIELKLSCISNINKDINECANIELCKDTAQLSIALTTINANDCENIIDSKIKNECINETTPKSI
jgi:hypothetical protein